MNYPQIKPTLNLDFSNTKTLDPRINFRRGTPGAYYDGKTYAKAEENLLSYSEDFSGWDTTNNLLQPSLVEGAGPAGTDAYKLIVDDTDPDYAFAYMNMSRENYLTSYSIYAKADGFNYVWIGFCYDTSLMYQSFIVDLTNGQVLDLYTRDRGNLMSVNVVSSGDDWYRIEFVSDGHVANYFSVGGISDLSTDLISDGRPFFQGDNTSGILVWGAQVEDRGYVTSYTSTMLEDGTSAPITKYQPQLMFASPDQPRFDHDPITGESKGLLIEESRTNLIEYSDLSASTASTGVTINRNTMIAPAGLIDAFKVSAAAALSVEKYNLTTQGKTYTMSIYAKTAERSSFKFLSNVSGSWQSVIFDLDAISFSKESGFSDASIIDVGNGWRRCSATFTDSVSQSKVYRFIEFTGGSSTDGMYFWGAQLEEGSFPTSYIKTSGAPSGTERSADNASITGENFSSWYRQDEGSIYVDSTKGNLGTSFAGYFSLHTEDFSNSEYYWLLHNSSDQFQFLVAPAIASLTDGVDVSLGSQKACVSWADDDFSMSVNGGAIQSDTGGPAKKNLAGLRIGFSPYSNSHYLNSTIKKLSYYPQRLTNEQLQQLTK